MASGKVITDIRARHTSEDFVAFLGLIDRNVPKDLDVHIILDNLSAHKAPKVKNWLLRHRRFHLHFTPTYGSSITWSKSVVFRSDHQKTPAFSSSQRERTVR